jgi:hypothetical protein
MRLSLAYTKSHSPGHQTKLSMTCRLDNVIKLVKRAPSQQRIAGTLSQFNQDFRYIIISET